MRAIIEKLIYYCYTIDRATLNRKINHVGACQPPPAAHFVCVARGVSSVVVHAVFIYS